MQIGLSNKNKANIILSSVFVLFVFAVIMKFSFRGSFTTDLLAFVAEAALIGGIADWFAVTALFRKPLGFSWHTAIIPNNRDKIIEKISSMVSEELLSIESIKTRLGGFNLVDTVLDRISGSMDVSVLENQVQSLVSGKIDEVDKTRVSMDINNFIKENLKKESVSTEIGNMLQNAFCEGKHRDWLRRLLEKAVEIAGRPSTREKIYKVLREQEKFNEENTSTGSFFVKALLSVSRSSKHTNLVTISKLLQEELLGVLKLISHPDHPIFRKILANAENMVKGLDEDQVLTQAVQTWKNGILDRVDLLETLRNLISAVIESEIYRNEAAGWIAGHLDKYRNDLKQDEEMREWVDDILKTMLEKVIRNEHYLIAEITTETLKSFTNERLNRFIEDKVGDDLQWIRINGSIVGAAAGLLIYLFTNLFYDPYVVPLIHGLFGIR